VGVDHIRVLRHPVPQMWAYARLHQADERLVVGDVQVVDPEGNLLAEIEGFRAQSLETSISLAPERIDKGLYELEWQLAEDHSAAASTVGTGVSLAYHFQQANEKPLSAPAHHLLPPSTNPHMLIFTDQSGVGEALIKCLEEHGEHYVTVSHADAPE